MFRTDAIQREDQIDGFMGRLKSITGRDGSIYLMDDTDTIIRKFKRAVTDSEAAVRYREEQPGIRNLIDIYCACSPFGLFNSLIFC